MEVTELGIDTPVKEVHPQKASSPIAVTELGIVTLSKGEFKKAALPMVVTVSGMMKSVSFEQ
jgi:hypothetical protein